MRAPIRYACCACCAEGVDPDLHSDPEFKGHKVGCTLCDNYRTWKP